MARSVAERRGEPPPPGARERWLGSSSGAVLFAALLLAAGIVMRLLAPFFMDLRMDGDTYAAMGDALRQHGEFLLPWGDVTTWGCTGPQYSHHYPPVYPAYLAAFYSVLGFGVAQTKLAAVVCSLAALGVVWLLTRDLLGKPVAFLTAGALAVDPQLLWSTGTGFSENMVLIFFALTMWAILRSLRSERYIIVAGVAAGMSYLTRSGMGVFFIVAGLGGLAWRFYYMRWAVFRNKSYLAAIAIFGCFVLAWSLRNLAHFGWPDWETSSYLTWTEDWAAAHPVLLAQGLAWKLPLFVGFVAHYAVPLGKECLRSARNVLAESESALWLAVGLVVLIGWALASIFWTWEQYDVWWLDNRRYVVIAFLPLLWLALRHADLGERRFQLRFAALGASLLLFSGYLFVEPVQFPEVHAAEALNPLLKAGDQIGIEGVIVKYSFYPYLQRHDIDVYGCTATATDPCPGQDPDYIISLQFPRDHPGYKVLRQDGVHYLESNYGTFYATTYVRDHPRPLGPRPPGCNPA
jgi:4-amino-4-deoxy-L-arabinose transferase-like glycosyltransferase